MASTQTSNAPTNNTVQTPVTFENVSLEMLRTHFNDTYKVTKGSSSQVVLGFLSMSERLNTPSNEYQQSLYPQLKQFCDTIVTKYKETFLTTFESDTERQVFGANLNGNRNTGSLYRSIPCGVNRNLTYNYAQFGQLVRVLRSRLRFVTQRDPQTVKRYKSSTVECAAYQKLQTLVTSFLTYLDTVSDQWNTLVTETRTKFSVETPQRQPREQREQRGHYSQQRTHHHSQNNQRQRSQPRQYKQVQQTTETSQQENNWTKVVKRRVPTQKA